MHRRRAIVLVASTCCATIGCASAAHANAGKYDRSPCLLQPHGLRGFSPWSPTEDLIESDSGFPQMERALGVALVHMATFYAVTPEFGFITEEQNPNAFATPYSPSGNEFGTVAFGRNLLTREISKPFGDYAVLAICAHEFGHIRQFRDGFFARIEQALPRFCVELHADFLAGAFISYWKRMMSIEALLRIGDTWSGLGSSDFNNPGSHGTSVQRVAAIEAGFFFRDANAEATIFETMTAGFEHVSRYA